MMAAMMRGAVSECRSGASKRMGMVVLVAAASALAAGGLNAQDGDNLGQVTYDRWCAGCHGVDGTGSGPGAGYMLPRPRDFTQAAYNIRTTASGDLPTDEDILRIIERGMPGTTMPGWEELLSDDEKDALVQYLKTFSRFFSPMKYRKNSTSVARPGPTTTCSLKVRGCSGRWRIARRATGTGAEATESPRRRWSMMTLAFRFVRLT